MLLQVSRLLIQETKKSLHFCFLTQAPTPLHSMGTSSQVKIELADSLSYSEGCYGSLPTLHETKNLWRLPGHLTVVQLLCFLLWTWHYLSPLVSELQRNRVISQDTICCEKKQHCCLYEVTVPGVLLQTLCTASTTWSSIGSSTSKSTGVISCWVPAQTVLSRCGKQSIYVALFHQGWPAK